jgi:signal transduction histidine kinase
LFDVDIKFRRLEGMMTSMKWTEGRDRHGLFWTLYENCSEGVLLLEANDDILSANSSACRLLEMSEEEIIESGRSGVMSPSEGRIVLSDGKGQVANNVFRRKDGTTFMAETTSDRFTDLEDGVRQCIIFKKVVSGLCQTGLYHPDEEMQRFYQILSSMPYGVLLVTNDDRVEFANQSFCHMFGLIEGPTNLRNISAAEMIQRIRTSYRDPGAALVRIHEIMDQALPVSGEELVMSGGRTVLRDFVPLTLGGRPYSYLWIHVDITDVKKAQRQAEEYSVRLVRSNKELKQFAYLASHDLQEPLRMVLSYLTLLKRKYENHFDYQAQGYIDFAVEGGTRMRELIDDLLEYSRVETKGRDFIPVNMNDLVGKTLSILKDRVEKSEAVVVVSDLPTITIDESQMIQVMQILIGNALKFRGSERPTIKISASRDGEEWTFSVEDNGIGMDMEHSERIFQMFQRLHTKEAYPGTGVGLAIAKKIVERHGGRIWVESVEGKGATFYFTIPARDGS